MIIQDIEFGEILIRKNPLAKTVRFAINNSGRLQISAPTKVPDFLIKKSIEANRQIIRAQLPAINPQTQKARDEQIRLLRKQAETFLPYRLEYLAKLHKFQYQKLRLAHQSTRWGSCTTNGTISLNIALMKLPASLRDYVIIHELCHLKYPDHSIAFWHEVGKYDPKYKYHREILKHYSPNITAN